jgi:phosphoglycerate dehydrogenase-like enzyme
MAPRESSRCLPILPVPISFAMRIALCYVTKPRHLQQISAIAPDAELVDASQEQIAKEIFNADIFCGHAKVPIDWDGVAREGRLQWIQSSAAGMDHCLVPSVIESKILVTSASGALADQVAEHTIALMTAWTRSLSTFFRAQQEKEFIRRPTSDLTRSTVGIVGLGGVGRRLSTLLSAFETRILAVDMFPVDKPEWVESLWPAERFDDLLPLVDFLVLCVPLNATTRGMIHSATIQKMKPGAVLVNIARGPLVVESHLVAALESGHLAGAVMDVTEPEPLPMSSRLWEMPQVIITPHVGGQAAWRNDKITDLFCRNFVRWKHGQPLINFLADKRLGFPIRGGGYPVWGEPGI